MRPITVWIAMALVMCGCGNRPGRNLELIDLQAVHVDGVEIRVVDYVPSDTSWSQLRLLLHNTNRHPVDVYLLHATHGRDTLAVEQENTYGSSAFPHCLRLAPDARSEQLYFVENGVRGRIRLDGWYVYRLDSMKAPSTRLRALGHWRGFR